MQAGGWTDEAQRSGAASSGFDLWRSVAVTYASAYGRHGVGEHPCGYGFSAQNADSGTRAAAAPERAAWGADAAGLPPGIRHGIGDANRARPYPTLTCLAVRPRERARHEGRKSRVGGNE